jgi:hypothetical protein
MKRPGFNLPSLTIDTGENPLQEQIKNDTLKRKQNYLASLENDEGEK